jgi:hypothetical protein
MFKAFVSAAILQIFCIPCFSMEQQGNAQPESFICIEQLPGRGTFSRLKFTIRENGQIFEEEFVRRIPRSTKIRRGQVDRKEVSRLFDESEKLKLVQIKNSRPDIGSTHITIFRNNQTKSLSCWQGSRECEGIIPFEMKINRLRQSAEWVQ